jgi:hypothetical protein
MTLSDKEALQKIRDPSVRTLAAEGSDANVDVLVELDLPIPPLYVDQDPLGSGIRSRSSSVSDCPAAIDDGEFEKFGKFLYRKSSREPTALRGGHAYATTLPARELIEVARHPLVHSVVPNRQLVVGLA